jgi:hypothetical protein
VTFNEIHKENFGVVLAVLVFSNLFPARLGGMAGFGGVPVFYFSVLERVRNNDSNLVGDHRLFCW